MRADHTDFQTGIDLGKAFWSARRSAALEYPPGRIATLEPHPESWHLIPMNSEFASLFKLGRTERLQLVEDLWDSIAQEETQLPLPDWKRDELRRRKEQFLTNPAPGRTWEQVRQRARDQNG